MVNYNKKNECRLGSRHVVEQRGIFIAAVVINKEPILLSKTDNSTNNTTYSSKRIKQALHSLKDSLGLSMVDALISELELVGLPLVNDHASYSYDQIHTAFAELLSRETADVIIERLKSELDG